MKGITVIVPESEVRRYENWTTCEAFRFESVDDGHVRFRVKGIETTDTECDWCQGRGSALQVGPAGQTAEVPCVNCGGTGRVAS